MADREKLARRERQIMDSLYRRGRATVAEVREDLPEPPTESAVRATLNLLEERGLVGHTVEGRRNVYRPSEPRERASRRALEHILRTFFSGSREAALAALLDAGERLSRQELDRLQRLIDRERETRGEDR